MRIKKSGVFYEGVYEYYIDRFWRYRRRSVVTRRKEKLTKREYDNAMLAYLRKVLEYYRL